MTVDKMPTTVKRKSIGRKKLVDVGWDQAIAEAKEQIKRLEFSIEVFEQNKREGRSWPSSTEPSATQN